MPLNKTSSKAWVTVWGKPHCAKIWIVWSGTAGCWSLVWSLLTIPKLNVDAGVWLVVALVQSGQMLWKAGQAYQSFPVKPGDIDVVGMAHGDGHLMSGLPAAKQVCFGHLGW